APDRQEEQPFRLDLVGADRDQEQEAGHESAQQAVAEMREEGAQERHQAERREGPQGRIVPIGRRPEGRVEMLLEVSPRGLLRRGISLAMAFERVGEELAERSEEHTSELQSR